MNQITPEIAIQSPLSNNLFGNNIPQGWYWAIASQDVAPGQIKPLHILGRDLEVFRTQSGEVRIIDASPSKSAADTTAEQSQVRGWPVREQFGLVWIWTGPRTEHAMNTVVGFEPQDTRATLGKPFVKSASPESIMVTTIAEQNRENLIAVGSASHSENHVEFVPHSAPAQFDRLPTQLAGFINNQLICRLSYWNGSSSSVTSGPQNANLHVIFALRPSTSGATEVQPILLNRRESSVLGYVRGVARLALGAITSTMIVNMPGARSELAQWSFETPTMLDHAIIRFIKRRDTQQLVTWGDWLPIEDVALDLEGSVTGKYEEIAACAQ